MVLVIMDPNTVKNCPHCGTPPQLAEWSNEWGEKGYYLCCFHDCTSRPTEEEAIEFWNKRHEGKD